MVKYKYPGICFRMYATGIVNQQNNPWLVRKHTVFVGELLAQCASAPALCELLFIRGGGAAAG